MTPDEDRARALDAALAEELEHLYQRGAELQEELAYIEKRVEHIRALLGDDAPADSRWPFSDDSKNAAELVVWNMGHSTPDRVWGVPEIVAAVFDNGGNLSAAGIRTGVKRAHEQGWIERVARGEYRLTTAGVEAARS